MVDPIVKSRIEALSPSYKEFVLSDFAEQTAQAFGKKIGLDDDKTIVFENGIAMYLLFFINHDELVEYIAVDCGIDINQSETIVTAIESGFPKEMRDGMRMAYATFEESMQESTNDSQIPKPKPEPQPQPQIQVKEEPKVEPHGNVATLKPKPAAQVPTGKMVGLKKEQMESSIKGMRTMRGDINKLRGSEEAQTPPSSDLTKPFKGK